LQWTLHFVWTLHCTVHFAVLYIMSTICYYLRMDREIDSLAKCKGLSWNRRVGAPKSRSWRMTERPLQWIKSVFQFSAIRVNRGARSWFAIVSCQSSESWFSFQFPLNWHGMDWTVTSDLRLIEPTKSGNQTKARDRV
jgi:hypothetical protein